VVEFLRHPACLKNENQFQLTSHVHLAICVVGTVGSVAASTAKLPVAARLTKDVLGLKFLVATYVARDVVITGDWVLRRWRRNTHENHYAAEHVTVMADLQPWHHQAVTENIG